MFLSLVAGLGNPGRDYEHTRHNVGWVALDALARKHRLSWQSMPPFEAEVARWDLGSGRVRWLVKPTTYMNASGRAIGALARYYKIAPEAVVAVYDDVSIGFGWVKVTVAGSAAGHNGVTSLLETMGDSFVRYRIGIGPKEPPEMELSNFVLGRFTAEQQTTLTQKLDYYVSGLELLLARGAEAAMNQLNRRDPK
jgi:PTH1 family peptidyl-tRNA hydrolase